MAAELLTITLAANQRRTFERGGRYLEIIEGDSPVDLFLYGPQGEQQDEARAIVSGLFLDQRDAFARFDVQNGATAQTIRLLVTDGRAGSRRAPGSVVVVDSIPATVASYTAGAGLAIGFNAVQQLNPALNVRGFVLRSLSGYAQSGATGAMNMRLVAAPAAPTDTAPGAARLWLADVLSTNGVIERFQFPDLKKIIPAGWGLWTVTQVATVVGTQGQHFISGELL